MALIFMLLQAPSFWSAASPVRNWAGVATIAKPNPEKPAELLSHVERQVGALCSLALQAVIGMASMVPDH